MGTSPQFIEHAVFKLEKSYWVPTNPTPPPNPPLVGYAQHLYHVGANGAKLYRNALKTLLYHFSLETGIQTTDISCGAFLVAKPSGATEYYPVAYTWDNLYGLTMNPDYDIDYDNDLGVPFTNITYDNEGSWGASPFPIFPDKDHSQEDVVFLPPDVELALSVYSVLATEAGDPNNPIHVTELVVGMGITLMEY